MTEQTGMLYLVPTPIGNMGDITARAVETLRMVDLVACEDTRVSGMLLKKFELKKRLISYHNFNEADRADYLLEELREGKSVAVVTDAGSPGISDPAYRVVRAALAGGIEIVALPGPCALIPALTASGLPTDRFFFEGFLSNKSSARRKRLERLAGFDHTLVFYESPHRVAKTLTDMYEVLGDREACVAREISKKFEQYMRGSLSVLMAMAGAKSMKGEIVIVVAGRSGKPDEPAEEQS
ncbi:MAG TPA: 16S rRNA (cytidine(1402)-2'-O)-methyltransferase [Candidatus Acidoferrum sp.]|nr:16S rRNA (cytidine(1402)-2'-O)-methyltransferase [Candidatus Acidoferrum sp.]